MAHLKATTLVKHSGIAVTVPAGCSKIKGLSLISTGAITFNLYSGSDATGQELATLSTVATYKLSDHIMFMPDGIPHDRLLGFYYALTGAGTGSVTVYWE